MFETEVKNTAGLGSWLVQQCVSIVVPLLWALFTSPVGPNLREMLGHPVGNIAAVLWNVLFLWSSGLYLGIVVVRAHPDAVTTGRWVWVLPTLCAILLIVHEAGRLPVSQVLAEFFSPDSDGEGQWAVMLLTYPTCSSICYALGATFAGARNNRIVRKPPSGV